jgi:hypothetical protein
MGHALHMPDDLKGLSHEITVHNILYKTVVRSLERYAEGDRKASIGGGGA